MTGLQNGQTIGSVNLASSGAVATANVASSPYVITPSNAMGGTFAPSDYSPISYVNGLLTVNPLPVTITGGRIYDGTTNLAGTLFSATNRLAGDSLTIGGSATADSANVGTYTVNGLAPNSLNIANLTLGGASAGNYTLTGASGSGTIDYRPITLTAGSNLPGTRLYGNSTNPVPTVPAEYTLGGLGMAGSENAKSLFGFTVGSAANNTTPVGVYLPGTAQAYKVGGVGIGINGNYQITAINDGTLTISPVAQPIKAVGIVQEIEPKPGPNYGVNSSGNTVSAEYLGEEDNTTGSMQIFTDFTRGLFSSQSPLPTTVLRDGEVVPMVESVASVQPFAFGGGASAEPRIDINLHHLVHSRLLANSRNPMRAMKYADKYGLKPFGLTLFDLKPSDLINAGLHAARLKLSQLKQEELKNYQLTRNEEMGVLIPPIIPVRIKPFEPFAEPNTIKWAGAGLELPRDVPNWGLLDNRLMKYSSNR